MMCTSIRVVDRTRHHLRRRHCRKSVTTHRIQGAATDGGVKRHGKVNISSSSKFYVFMHPERILLRVTNFMEEIEPMTRNITRIIIQLQRLLHDTFAVAFSSSGITKIVMNAHIVPM